MWNSPQSNSKTGKRYQLGEIAALIYPLDRILDFVESMPVRDVVQEEILRRMDKEELIFGIYQVLQSLLEDAPIPAGGHTGFQEAIVAELLSQTYDQIACELEDAEMGHFAREAAWRSVSRFCTETDAAGNKVLRSPDDLKLNLDDPRVYLSEELTAEAWEDLLIGDSGLWNEFLWDDDWRMDSLMDLPPATSEKVTAATGINLEVVHKLPHTPTRAELIMATHYIKYVIWKEEAAQGR